MTTNVIATIITILVTNIVTTTNVLFHDHERQQVYFQDIASVPALEPQYGLHQMQGIPYLITNTNTFVFATKLGNKIKMSQDIFIRDPVLKSISTEIYEQKLMILDTEVGKVTNILSNKLKTYNFQGFNLQGIEPIWVLWTNTNKLPVTNKFRLEN